MEYDRNINWETPCLFKVSIDFNHKSDLNVKELRYICVLYVIDYSSFDSYGMEKLKHVWMFRS